ncbi:interleukin-34 precursor, partial [Silurus meridionalis]
IGLLWALPIWVNSHTPEFCTSLETLKDQLNSSLRRRYLKHNFPINYTIQVHYEEVFRLKNISRMMNETEDVRDLQDLWVKVTVNSIERILTVLPERHPTRYKYLNNLDSLFKTIQESYPKRNSDEVRTKTSNYPESIEKALESLQSTDLQRMKSVTPKSLFDNCYRTMHCLFQDCFPRNSSQND